MLHHHALALPIRRRALEEVNITGVHDGDVDSEGIIHVAPFVRALMQSHKLHRWATPSIIPSLCLPGKLNSEYSISVDQFGSHLDNTGLLGDVALRVAKLLGGDYGWFSTSGTSCTNHKIMLMMSQCFPEQPVLSCRNVHHSITHSSMMYKVPLLFVKAKGYIEEFEAILPPSAEDVDSMLTENPNVALVLVTSPTYEGIIADIEAISAVTRKHGVLLWVDQAWGAHLGLHPDVPKSAMQLGADIIGTSPHKTGGALQGASMMVYKRGPLMTEAVELGLRDGNLQEETTSPNFQIIASIDAAVCRLATDQKPILDVLHKIKEVKKLLQARCGFPFLDQSHPMLQNRGYFLDPVRLSIALPKGTSGPTTAHWLEHHGVVVEKCGLTTILIIACFQLPPCAPTRFVNGLITTVEAQLKEASPHANSGASFSRIANSAAPEWLLDASKQKPEPVVPFNPRILPAMEAVGYTANETIECYPPGIPVIISGYKVSADCVQYLLDMNAAGAHIVASDRSLATIRVRVPKTDDKISQTTAHKRKQTEMEPEGR